MDRRKSPSRAGFTLVEVLVAILIIATLVAILLPAVRGAFRKAQEAQVSTELNNLATALASFKNTYGDYPPSRVMLCEGGFNSLPPAFLAATVGSPAAVAIYPEQPMATGATDITNQQLMQRSLLYLRRFWPRCDFNSAPNAQQISQNQFNDFDGNGVIRSAPVILSGSECLAFFLGGLPIQDKSNPKAITGTSGFSKLLLYPFVSAAVSNNRTVPNYEFNTARLIDLDGDGFPSYIDPLDVAANVRPYAYFSTYGGNSFDPNDDNGSGRLNALELEDDGSTIVQRGYQVGFPVYDASATVQTYSISPAPNPYTSGTPIQGTTGVVSWINPNGFQLFSAGADRLWGLGGQYVQNSLGSVGRLPIVPSDPGIVNAMDTTNGIRNRESDNITNFSGGRLD